MSAQASLEQAPPSVTVVIPAYKAARTIARAVDSVLAQPDCQATVVIVLDGPDAKAEAAIPSDPRVRLMVNPHNLGQQLSRTRGLEAATDPLILFLDADDFLEGAMLASLAGALQDASADLGFAPMHVLIEGSGERRELVDLSGKSREALFEDWLGGGQFVAPCSVLWRTDFLRAIGGWDPTLRRQEDGELVLRALLRDARTAFSSEGHGVYVQHASTDRLTRRSDNLDSLLDVPAKILALDPGPIPTATVRRACAASYRNAARTAYLRGSRSIGREALARAGQLDPAGRSFPGPFGQLARLVGFHGAVRVERMVRGLLRKPY